MSDKERNPSNWYNQLESNRQFVIGAVVLLCCAITIVISLRNPIDYDSFWHLQMGKDLVENGLSPYQDHYSFTYNNETITSPPVLFQVGLYGFVKLFGEWGGFIAFKLLAFLLTIGLMLAWLKQIKSPALVYCLVLPMLVILIQLRAQLRPELISYSLSIIALMLYQRAHLQLTVRAIAPIVLLLLFWVNYHSAILGYVIFFALFIDIGLKLTQDKAGIRSWATWAGWGCALIAIGFLNPSVSHPVLESLTFQNEWKTLINEYRSPIAYSSTPSIYILILLTVTALIMAVRQRKIGYLICGGVMLYAGSTMMRMVTPSGIIFLALFAHLASNEKMKDMFELRENKQLRAALAFSLLTFLIPMWENVAIVRHEMFTNRYRTALFPEQLITYMHEHNKAGRIFNAYSLGGYLIHNLSPESQVYIDGRTNILYPLQHMRTYNTAIQDSAVLANEIDKYGIDFTVLPADSNSAIFILDSGELALDFVDVNFALYSREAPLLPITGQMWARPYCWSNTQSKNIHLEWQAAIQNLPPASPIIPLLALATEYALAENAKAYLTSLSPRANWNDDSKRFAGYRALEHNLHGMAIKLFSAISFDARHRKDYLALALAHSRNGQFKLAEQVLGKASKRTWHRLEFNEILIMKKLLDEIQGQHPLEHLDQGFIESITRQTATFPPSNKNERVSIHSFCDSP